MRTLKKYQVWENNYSEGWSLSEFNTLKEAVEAHKHSEDWVLTKGVDLSIRDTEEQD